MVPTIHNLRVQHTKWMGTIGIETNPFGEFKLAAVGGNHQSGLFASSTK